MTLLEEDRIARIARAMCRAARLDPDRPATDAELDDPRAELPGEDEAAPAWTLFREQAERFVAQHAEIARAL